MLHHIVVHVRQDCRLVASCAQTLCPQENIWIQARPHRHVCFPKLINLIGTHLTPGRTSDLFPILRRTADSAIIVKTELTVDSTESVFRQPEPLRHPSNHLRVGRQGNDISEIQNDGTNCRQGRSGFRAIHEVHQTIVPERLARISSRTLLLKSSHLFAII